MGKSTSGDLLKQRGFSVIDTDETAHRLVEPGQPALLEIVKAFGASILDSQGKLIRAELAKIVFTADAARRQLEEILHPRIREVWQSEAAKWRQQKKTFGFVLIPLLFETEAAAQFDAIICVACSEATQRTRLKKRGWTDEQINQRIAAQWPVSKKMDQSRFVVWTDTSVEIHGNQLDRILFSS